MGEHSGSARIGKKNLVTLNVRENVDCSLELATDVISNAHVNVTCSVSGRENRIKRQKEAKVYLLSETDDCVFVKKVFSQMNTNYFERWVYWLR